MDQELGVQIVVLGGGPAGYVAAIRAAQLGADVAVIEKKDLGGVCMNAGCIPTKALLESSHVAAAVNHSKEFGVDSRLTGISWNQAVTRKNRIVKSLNLGLEYLMKSNGIQVLNGSGTVLSPNKILVESAGTSTTVNCGKLILATGSSPLRPDIPGINYPCVITSNEVLDLETIPERLGIIGGGVIGVEFASMFREAGSKVTILEKLDQLLPFEDEAISTGLYKNLKRQGIGVKLGVTVTEIQADGTVIYETGEKQQSVSFDLILVAAGRKLNTESFQNLALSLEHGSVPVNECMETEITGVYAAGDVIGGKLLAHLAFMEGKTAAENAMGMKHVLNRRAVPACVYTTPEIATVGLSEKGAAALGIQVKTGEFLFRNNGRALTLGEREGFVKVITGQNNVILGGEIFGSTASELISELTLAITLNARADVLADMIHPHPSLSEAIWEACGDVCGRAIHK